MIALRKVTSSAIPITFTYFHVPTFLSPARCEGLNPKKHSEVTSGSSSQPNMSEMNSKKIDRRSVWTMYFFCRNSSFYTLLPILSRSDFHSVSACSKDTGNEVLHNQISTSQLSFCFSHRHHHHIRDPRTCKGARGSLPQRNHKGRIPIKQKVTNFPPTFECHSAATTDDQLAVIWLMTFEVGECVSHCSRGSVASFA